MELADRFAVIPDGAVKTALAIEKFGMRLGPGLIPLLNEGSRGLAEMAQQSDAVGNTLSTAAAEGADEFNDKMGLLKATVDGFVNSLMVEMLPALNAVSDQLTDTATRSDTARRFIESLSYTFKSITELALNSALSFGAMGDALGALGAAANQAARGNFSEALAIMQDSNARQIEMEARTNETIRKIWSDTAEAKEKAWRPPPGRNRTPTVLDPTAFDKPKPPAKEKRAASLEEELSAEAKKYAQIGTEYWDSINFRASLTEDIANSAAQGISTIGEEMERNLDAVAQQNQQMTVFAEQAARNMQTAFADFLFDPFEDGLKGMAAGFLDMIRRMVAELAAQQLLLAFFNWGSGLGGGVGSFFGSLAKGISGTRANGGPVSAGGMYLVGERGPELLRMGSSGGTVIPNNAMGGVALTYNIDARGADAERIMAIMPGLLQRTKSETVAEIRNLVARGRM
jgi:hypothetical protein